MSARLFGTLPRALIETWLILVAAAFAASTVAAIAGTGGGVILLPVLVAVFGVREAVPIYAVAQLVGNLSRVGFNRALIDFRVVGWFVLGALPCAVIGAWLFTRLPDAGLLRILGLFLVASVVVRRRYPRLLNGFRAWWFAPVGGVFSCISGLVGSAGPFLAPFYLSYGLTKGAFIGTEALGTVTMHVAKLWTYRSLGAMDLGMWGAGLLLGPVMIAGSYVGKRILDRMSVRGFLLLVEAAIAGFGLWFLIR